MSASRLSASTLAALCTLGLLAPCAARAQDRIIAVDSSASIIVPPSWQPLPLNDGAILQFGNPTAELYVMVLIENKEDMFGWNLTRHGFVTAAQMVGRISLPEVDGPVSVSVGGNPALQYEIQGATDGVRVAYLHTSIESPTTFAHVLAWTLGSRWKASQQVLRDVVASIELHGPVGGVADDIFGIVPGTWAWESDDVPCAGLTQRFEIAADRASMRIHHSEAFESATGELTAVTDYVIEDWGDRVIHSFIPGETRLTDEGDPVKWDLVAVGRNRIAWHRADWPEGALTGMLRRCDVP